MTASRPEIKATPSLQPETGTYVLDHSFQARLRCLQPALTYKRKADPNPSPRPTLKINKGSNPVLCLYA